MPEYLAPGVYIEEIASGAHAIAGVSTATTAFIGATQTGPLDAPLLVRSFADFQARFGGLAADMPLGYAVQHYFLNGGREALIARMLPTGAALTDADLSSPALEQSQRGLWLLAHAEHFEILCIPPLTRTTDVGSVTWNAAVAYAERRRAFVIVDPPAAWTGAQSVSDNAVAAVVRRSANAALYYPRLTALDPLSGQPASFAPCGAVAGIYARTAAARGVWTSPAGTEATLLGVAGLGVALTDAQLSALDSMGVDGLRTLPGGGSVVWGARTLIGAGADVAYKYVSLRRTQLFVESSIAGGLQWAVFEPNGEPLWAAIRWSVGDFLHGLFQQGAFQGNTPDKAYFVRCDATTMSQQDIDAGRVNVLVGMALLKPAEFVIVGIQVVLGLPWVPVRDGRVGRYRLRVLVGDQALAGVSCVRGLGQQTEIVAVHEAGDPNPLHSILGRTTFAPVTLERPVTRDDAFEAWADAVRTSGTGGTLPPRETVRIELYDHEQLTAIWRLSSALPMKYEAPDLNAEGDDVAMETLTLAHEGLSRQLLP